MLRVGERMGTRRDSFPEEAMKLFPAREELKYRRRKPGLSIMLRFNGVLDGK